MENARDIVRQCARGLGLRVINAAKEAGVPDDEIKAMKARMTKWVKILSAYRKDMADVRADESVSRDARTRLIAVMKRNLNDVRRDIFGL